MEKISRRKLHILRDKLIFTWVIVFIYLLGRCLPLYGVDTSAYSILPGNAEILLMQVIGGDVNRYSLFALGISPYMISSVLTQIVVSCRNPGSRARTSPKKVNQAQIALTFGFALFQAVIHVQNLKFRVMDAELFLTEFICVAEMVTGVMTILWLAGRNKKYGLGGQTVLIYINIIDGMFTTLMGHRPEDLGVPLGVSLAVMVIMIIMENGEKRIPVQRISIHNIYADKNYLAIKLNPVGVMPVMFSTAFFMLPQLIITALLFLFPEREKLIWWKENMVLTRPVGIGIYILILYLLTIGFSMIFISPGDAAEQLLKSGDSILNLHAGKDTQKYLTREVLGIGVFSATVMSLCLGVPMVLQLRGNLERELVMLPASVMMLTSLWCSLYQEFLAIKSYEAYEPFI